MLELGKYYQQRDGLVVGPLDAHKSSSIGFEDYAFKAVGGHLSSFATRIWKADGSFHIDGSESDYDLISEVQFKPLNEQPKEEIVSKPLKLEAGKYYKDREGDVYGPIDANDHPIYSFTDGDLIWTENGNYYEIGESDYDLIKEVPNPNQESEPMSEQPKSSPKFKEITLMEALDVVKNGGKVYGTDDDYDRVVLDKSDSVGWLLTVTKFEIEVKPVVKYLVVYGDSWGTYISEEEYESIESFYEHHDQSQYQQAELIQFTRKEF